MNRASYGAAGIFMIATMLFIGLPADPTIAQVGVGLLILTLGSTFLAKALFGYKEK